MSNAKEKCRHYEGNSVTRDALLAYLDETMQTARFRDYCPNGLQVEGRAEIRKIVTGVTASQALLDEAVARRADAVLVHHGYFWRGEDGRITGMRKRRLASLLGNDINLFAYHLPLDAHAEWGNNAQLARSFGWQPEGHFGDQDIGWFGVQNECSLSVLAQRIQKATDRVPLALGDPDRSIRRVAWCSGGAQSHFEEAINLGVDLFVTGEVSEPCYHLAMESGVAYLAAGHHATERFGVRALGEHLAEHFGLQVEFVDVQNPV